MKPIKDFSDIRSQQPTPTELLREIRPNLQTFTGTGAEFCKRYGNVENIFLCTNKNYFLLADMYALFISFCVPHGKINVDYLTFTIDYHFRGGNVLFIESINARK